MDNWLLNAVSWLVPGFVCLTDEGANRDIVLVLASAMTEGADPL